ncbi:MAG: hypothetical protein JKY42_09765 [Flavobacteriales bacterium]|nr:hypothetical protein [Flavobacteriales bacterium]
MSTLKFITLLILTFTTSLVSAQSGDIEMADAMHENGKIYVVIAVLCIVFVGLITYTVLIDKRLTKLEKEVNEK